MVSTYYLVKLFQNAKAKTIKTEKSKEAISKREFISVKSDLPNKCFLTPDLINNSQSLKQETNKNRNDIKCLSNTSHVTFRICRLCLKPGSEPILYRFHSKIPLSLCLKFICDIDINANDIYPKYLCESCYNTIIAAMKLRSTAMKTQSKLRKMYSNCQNTSKSNKSGDQREWKSDVPSSERDIDATKKLRNTATKLRNTSTKQRNTTRKTYAKSKKTFKRYNKSNTQTKSEPNESMQSQSGQEDEGSITYLEIDFSYSSNNVKKEREFDKVEYNLDAELQQKNDTSNLMETPELKMEEFEKHYKELFIEGKGILFECQICKKTIKRGTRPHHFRTHLPDSAFQYICEKCGKTFKQFCHFHQHRKIHVNILSFKCNKCPYVGRTKDSLQVHTKRMHIKAYTYQCTLCPKKFLESQDLKRHVVRHSDPKYHCDICNRSFYENYVLKQHIKHKHMDEEPHKCEICGNIYKRRKHLLIHQIKVHKRKRVYNNRANYLKHENVIVTNELDNEN